MKTLFCLLLLSFVLFSCEDDLEDHRALYNVLAGEWNITQITYPLNDSTVNVSGKTVFTACEVQNNGCPGYFSIYDETINFTYQAHPFFDATSQITIGPTSGQKDNALKLQVSTFNILEIDRNNLTIDLAYCAFDAENNCTTVHRHLVMSR